VIYFIGIIGSDLYHPSLKYIMEEVYRKNHHTTFMLKLLSACVSNISLFKGIKPYKQHFNEKNRFSKLISCFPTELVCQINKTPAGIKNPQQKHFNSLMSGSTQKID